MMICRKTNKYLLLAVLICVALATRVNAQVVMLDYYFNHEVHKNAAGQQQRFHYLWDETANTGFSIWGEAFKTAGATLDTLAEAPNVNNLKKASIYIIVDPDSKKENPDPHYINETEATAIATWVKKGGVLVMMANDSATVELAHFNILAGKFGLHFNNDLQNHVIDDNHFEDGAIVLTDNPVFPTAGKIFMKDVCSINTIIPARAVITKNSAVIMATVKYGKGTVLAVGDPWLYNEYVNGRLPAGFENDKAAHDISAWLLKQVR